MPAEVLAHRLSTAISQNFALKVTGDTAAWLMNETNTPTYASTGDQVDYP
ncbi:hypothetical protein [Leptodesmis sichuanensis]|nr:hypothetical protein [Leptodesmis sichuanensis]UIE37366.1 hypothetical protein KIK02_20870 [Leptodesmis sichuanensis A121]